LKQGNDELGACFDVDAAEDDPPFDNIIWDDENDEDLSMLMAVQRVNSQDIVYDNRAQKVKILGKYIMGDVLGEGSYAKVKEAIDRENLCRRAVKIMKRKKLRKIPRGEENVEREIKLISQLNHQNVMKLVEVFYNDEKGKIYMVLEYCCAVLKDMLEQSPFKKFPAWQAHYYFCQLTEGLEYLQSNRIVHKDIKPGNLLLNNAGILKIADFGVAEKLDLFAPDDTITMSQGTPVFQPPEIAIGVEQFSGFKVDIWSSGVTLYNFVTGEYPFDGDTIFRLFENIAKGEFKIPRPEVDSVLESLINGMLCKSISERFTLKQVRQHDWCRKRFPCNSPPVTVTPREGDDGSLSMSVLPYLYSLHYEQDSELDEEEEFLTDHDVNNGKVGAGEEAFVGSPEHQREKTTRCIKVRKISGCTLF
jgi:serine/threonine-protein kinase 11